MGVEVHTQSTSQLFVHVHMDYYLTWGVAIKSFNADILSMYIIFMNCIMLKGFILNYNSNLNPDFWWNFTLKSTHSTCTLNARS